MRAADLGLDPGEYEVHPALLDAATHLLKLDAARPTGSPCPCRSRASRLYHPPGLEFCVHARLAAPQTGDVDLLDAEGRCSLTVRAIHWKEIEGARDEAEPFESWLYEVRLKPKALPAAARAAGGPSTLDEGAADALQPVAANADARRTEVGWLDFYDVVGPRLSALARGFVVQALAEVGPGDVVEGHRELFARLLDQLASTEGMPTPEDPADGCPRADRRATRVRAVRRADRAAAEATWPPSCAARPTRARCSWRRRRSSCSAASTRAAAPRSSTTSWSPTR